MMWGSIANLKENLTKIALDVHDDDDYDDDEELSIYRSRNAQIPNSPYSDRRVSHRFANSSSGFDTRSPRLNGIDGGSNPEIEQYKTEIKRLRESEAEIKALSVNYAALLKEKEDQIVRLNQENGRLKQNLDATSAVLSASRNDSPRASTTSLNVVKGGEQSPKQHKLTTVKNRLTGAQSQNGVAAKHDGHSNGFAHSAGNAKELADLLEEKDKFLESMQANHESQVKNLRMELEKERERSANMQLKLQEVQRMSDSLKEELTSLKSEHNKTPAEINKLRNELDDKVSEIRRLQMELDRREGEEAGGVDSLRRVIAALEKEKSNLKMEKEELEAELKASKSSSAITADALGMKHASNTDEKAAALINSPRKDELEHSLQKMERDLKDTRRERDKALQELARLKQHLLEKEAEESEKMDEDSNIIEELRQHVEHQKATILNLERALQQAYASQEEVRMTTNGELQKSREVIEDLKKKIAGYMNTIDAKNVELLNLQTALGQYYAEIEAKERLEGELSIAREECAKLSQLLKDANQEVEASKTEREVILAKLEQAERMLVEGKNRVNKLQEDNEKLRRALEQSMTRLNRMSVDSDFLVDRRIVVKLLVTYFQRNHSKEVLDLMVRMLGFSDEDKQRIGVAQHGAGKGVVRGVLGLPGRFVGGIIGGSSAGQSTNLASDNQSFADLWVDFLLKESEEREKRESVESSNVSKADSNPKPPSTPGLTSSVPDQRRSDTWRPPLSPTPSPTPLQTSRSLYPYTTPRQYEYYTGSEFSTVPLTPSNSSSRNLPLPEY